MDLAATESRDRGILWGAVRTGVLVMPALYKPFMDLSRANVTFMIREYTYPHEVPGLHGLPARADCSTGRAPRANARLYRASPIISASVNPCCRFGSRAIRSHRPRRSSSWPPNSETKSTRCSGYPNLIPILHALTRYGPTSRRQCEEALSNKPNSTYLERRMKRKDALDALHRIWPQLTPLQRKWLLIQAETAYLLTKLRHLMPRRKKQGAGHHALPEKHMPGKSP